MAWECTFLRAPSYVRVPSRHLPRCKRRPPPSRGPPSVIRMLASLLAEQTPRHAMLGERQRQLRLEVANGAVGERNRQPDVRRAGVVGWLEGDDLQSDAARRDIDARNNIARAVGVLGQQRLPGS